MERRTLIEVLTKGPILYTLTLLVLYGCTGKSGQNSYSLSPTISLPSQPQMISTAKFNSNVYQANFSIAETNIRDVSCMFVGDGDFLLADYGDGVASCELSALNVSEGNTQLITRLCNLNDACAEYYFDLIKDTQGPEINLISEGVLLDSKALFTISDTHSQVSEVFYTMGGNREEMVVGENIYILNMPPNTPTGSHEVTIVAMDELNNMANYTDHLLVLRDQPFISLISPQSTTEPSYRVQALVTPSSYQGNYSGSCLLDQLEYPATIHHNVLSCSDISMGIGWHNLTIQLMTDYEMEYTFVFTISRIPRVQRQHRPVVKLTSANTTTQDFYNLTARLDRDGYEGSYETWCSLAGHNVSAYLIDDVFGCSLNISDVAIGEWSLEVLLRDDNDKLYKQAFRLFKDQLAVKNVNETKGNSTQMDNMATGANQSVPVTLPKLWLTSANLTADDSYNLTAGFIGTDDRYDFRCGLSDQLVQAEVVSGELSCMMNLTSWTYDFLSINVSLWTEREARGGGGKIEIGSQELVLFKDSKPPFVAEYDFKPFYNQSYFSLDFVLVDKHSGVKELYASYGDNQTTEGWWLRDSIWRIHIDGEYLVHGDNTIRILAIDGLGNQYHRNHQIVYLKEPLALRFSHAPLIRGGPLITLEGETNFVTPLGHVYCQTETGRYYNRPPQQGRLVDNGFSCDRLLLIQNRAEQEVEVTVCNIYGTCITDTTLINHDSRRPITHAFHQPARTSYYKHCLVQDRHNIPSQCIRVDRNATDNHWSSDRFYRLATRAVLPEPQHILLSQATAELNNINTSDIGQLDRRGIDYVGVDVADDENFVFPNYYASPASRLNITYSYTQLNCQRDDHHCVGANRENYFINRPVPHKELINNNTRIRVIVPFIAQYLNIEGKPPWFLTPAKTIHRIDLAACDEAGNCRNHVVHFRALVSFEAPMVRDLDVPVDTIRLLGNGTMFTEESHIILVTKHIQITNPTLVNMWYRFPTERPTQVDIHYAKYRRVNAWQSRYYSERVSNCRISYLPFSGVRFSWAVNYVAEEFFGPVHEFYADISSMQANRFLPSPTIRRRDYFNQIYLFSTSCDDIDIYEDIRHAGTVNQQAPGYPRNQLVNQHYRSETVPMNFYDIRAADGFVYDFNNYRLLSAGSSHTIEYRETVPLRSGYTHVNQAQLPLPPNYRTYLEYDRAAAIHLNNDISIEYSLTPNDMDAKSFDYVASQTQPVMAILRP